MKLFELFSKKISGNGKELPAPENGSPVVPESLFIDNSEPVDTSTHSENSVPAGMEEVYAFLLADYEEKGYNDALTNPDTGYRDDNIRLLKEEFGILIKKTILNFEVQLNELEFHIETRSRAGLIDLVEELKARRNIIFRKLEDIIRLKQEEGNGAVERMVLSYKKGFMRGLAAITKSELIRKNI